MMKKQADKTDLPLRVAIVGLDDQLNLFRVILTKAFGAFFQAKDEIADVVIVNMDAYGAPALGKAYHDRFPAVPMVLLGTEPKADEPGILWVRRPIRTEDLLSALRKSTGRGTSNDRGPKRDEARRTVADRVAALTESGKPHRLSLSAQFENPQLFYDPGQYLQGVVTQIARSADAEDKVYVLNGVAGDRIHVLPSGVVRTHLSDAKLRFHSVIALSDWAAKTSALPDSSEVPSDARSIPFDEFIWKVTIWTARGRLTVGTHADAPARLAFWPNFTRLLPVEHGLRLAAYWIRNEASVHEVAKQLGLPLAVVCDFHSAASAVGAMETAAHARPSRILETPAPSKAPAEAPPRGMLSRLMGKLLSFTS
jgi:hypothetical protein